MYKYFGLSAKNKAMSVIKETERSIILQFRKLMADILPEHLLQDDFYLLRWLRARELDLAKAEDMLRKSLAWRAANKVESIISETLPQKFHQNFPYYLEGIDKFNGPVLCVPVGEYDIRKIVEDEDTNDFIRYMNQMLERIMLSMKTLNDKREIPTEQNYISQFTAVVDFHNFAYSQLTSKATVNTILDIVRIYEANYPEVLRRVFIVNAPLIFSILMKLMKPLLSERTMSKLSIHKSNKSSWEGEVAKFISPEQIIPRFGGTKVSSDTARS